MGNLSHWFLPQVQSLKSGKAQIVNQIKFLHFGKKVQKVRFCVLHDMAGRRTAVTSGALRSSSPGLPSDQAMQVLIGDHDDKKDDDNMMTTMMLMKMIISLIKQCKQAIDCIMFQY